MAKASGQSELSSPGVSVFPRGLRFDVLALAGIVLLCGALRAYHLGSASLWSDEIFSRYYADIFGLHYLVTDGLSNEPTPPTYTILLRGWIAMWGGSESALRSLSTLACVLCVPVTYLLGKELSGKSQGLVGALLFALCPTSLYFGQEARVYALFMLVTSLALWAGAAFLRDPGPVRTWVFYVVCATCCVYLHATGVIFVAACAGAVWLFLLTQGIRGRSALLKWTGLNVLVLLLGLPYLLHASRASRGGGLDWMPPVGLRVLTNVLSTVVSGVLTPYPWPSFVLAAGLMAALAISLYLHPLSARANVVLIGAPCLFTALVFGISLSRPILLPRILAWAVVPLCLIAGRQLLMAGRFRWVVLLGVAATFGVGLFFQITTQGGNKEPWREAVRSAEPALEQADLVVLSPLANPMVLLYYAPNVKNVRVWDASLRPTIMNAAAEKLHIEPITERDIVQAIQARRSVWIVSNGFDISRVNNLRSRLPSSYFREWPCGKNICVGVTGWQPH